MADVGGLTAYLCVRELVHHVYVSTLWERVEKEAASFWGQKYEISFILFSLELHDGAVYFLVFFHPRSSCETYQV